VGESDVALFPHTTLFRSLDEHWGSTQMVTRGRILYGHLLPGFVAERTKPPAEGEDAPVEIDDDATEENPIVTMEKIGLLTYNVRSEEHTSELKSRENLVC